MAILDFQASPTSTLHLAHPRPVPWCALFDPIAEALGVPLVSFTAWLDKLELVIADAAAADTDMLAARNNSLLRVMSAFSRVNSASMAPTLLETLHTTPLDTTHAAKASPALRDVDILPVLGKPDVDRWLSYWRRVGALDSIATT